jgi:diguanylate cyclase (GGDEF)-like protein
MDTKQKLKHLTPNLREKLASLVKDIEENISVLYELATHDEKTGIYNYRFFQNMLDMEFEKAKRGKPLSLLIIDIDYFKKINDKFGHLTGDKILLQSAKIIKNNTRKSDIAARFGGEEFLVLLPNTNISKAKRVAERIRRAVEKNLKKYSVTISGGIACYKKGYSKEKLKQRADKALYKAKEKGRNRIEI